jgi:hypothetical protein
VAQNALCFAFGTGSPAAGVWLRPLVNVTKCCLKRPWGLLGTACQGKSATRLALCRMRKSSVYPTGCAHSRAAKGRPAGLRSERVRLACGWDRLQGLLLERARRMPPIGARRGSTSGTWVRGVTGLASCVDQRLAAGHNTRSALHARGRTETPCADQHTIRGE